MSKEMILPISEARKKIFEIAQEVQEFDTYYILTEHGKPKVALLSSKTFESWKATVELIQSEPGIKNSLLESEKQYKLSQYIEIEKLLEKEGLLVSDKHKKMYDASGSSHKKGRRKSAKK